MTHILSFIFAILLVSCIAAQKTEIKVVKEKKWWYAPRYEDSLWRIYYIEVDTNGVKTEKLIR